ncbi:hypothetical protein GLYMA_20G051300v4 [Glycine max]|nr:hypothetical protein GLYMA_20G051300v4 [Glycine max]KAG4954818.1 hypothetical protein JHK87_040412 [Glycine soja]
MGKSSDSPPCVLTLVDTLSYISWIARIYATLTPFFSRAFHKISLGTLSYAFSKSIKIKCKSCWSMRYCSITRRNK